MAEVQNAGFPETAAEGFRTSRNDRLCTGFFIECIVLGITYEQTDFCVALDLNTYDHG
jgi:hypothetical protein